MLSHQVSFLLLFLLFIRIGLNVVCVYLGFFIGVPHKRESIESHFFYVANAAKHLFVIRCKRKRKWLWRGTLWLYIILIQLRSPVFTDMFRWNIPMSMTLCLAVGCLACQWFQKRSCISGFLSFSNTAITTVYDRKARVRILFFPPTKTWHCKLWVVIILHSSLEILLFSLHCHQLFTVSWSALACVLILWFTKQRKQLSPVLF